MGELNRIRKECKAMVAKRAVASGGVAMIPIPGTDIAADMSMLLELLPSINRKFGLSEEQISELDTTIKPVILSLITKGGSKLIGRAITKELIIQVLKKIGVRVAGKQVAKYVPVLGQITAGVLSFSAMKMLGDSHVNDCYRIIKEYLEKQAV
jgi:uncharacterized protein (DUF697 family)